MKILFRVLVIAILAAGIFIGGFLMGRYESWVDHEFRLSVWDYLHELERATFISKHTGYAPEFKDGYWLSPIDEGTIKLIDALHAWDKYKETITEKDIRDCWIPRVKEAFGEAIRQEVNERLLKEKE